jgi:hypothetical protein
MKYIIQYWTNEENREQGISDIYFNDLNNIDEAIRQAQKIVDNVGYACAEVIEFETNEVVYGYDGIDFWYGGKKLVI